MPLLTRKRTILAKIESTYATDPTPTGAANAILVRNLTVTPQNAEFASRDLIRPYLGNSEQLPTAISAQLEFEIEVAGAGAAGSVPKWGPLLRACAFSETISAGVNVIYAPVSSAFESVTMYLNEDGVLHKMTGARGTVSFQMNVKSIPVMRFRFLGLYSAVTDAAAPTAVYTGWVKPIAVNNSNTPTVSLHGISVLALSQFSVDVANNVVFRALLGGESVQLTDRRPTGAISFEAVTVATKDWWTAAKTATTGAFQMIHGTVAGNKVQFDAPAMSVSNPRYEDLDGIAMLTLGLIPVPGSAGNDELTVTVF